MSINTPINQPPIVDLSPVLDMLPPPSEEPQQTFISSRDRVLDTPMASLPEFDLVRALLNSGYPVILPPTYATFPQVKDLVPATGPMVVGYKVQKLSTSKVTLWVRFTSPCEYVVNTIQMYPQRLEPKKGPTCGADFSLACYLYWQPSSHHAPRSWYKFVLINCSHQHAASTFLFYAKDTGFYDCHV